MSINHHGQLAGVLVLVNRATAEVTSFDSAHDLLIWAMSKVPLETQISEFSAVMDMFGDSQISIPTPILMAHREHIDRAIDKRAMRNLKGSAGAETTKGK